ncbi:PrgI family protein [Nocardiopsis sp. NPDC101807]|uniref:PrgI family protein n=1 Tax=Nocardiopsis sp. NPDC101807 TaxID=3364339 RepID=UPI00381D5F2B
MDQDASTWRARVPADIDRPEPVLWNLTARQLLLMAPAALASWAVFSAGAGHLPAWLLGTAAAVLLGPAWALACGRRDGVGLDRLAWSALRWGTAPRTRRADEALPAVGADGVVDLGGRSAVVLACTSVPLHLSSGEEQDRALATFAALLDSLAEPVQILVRRRPADLAPHTRRLRRDVPRLPAGLRRAALAHAAFLDDLQARHEPTHHGVLLVLTSDGAPETAGEALLRRAEDTASHLAALDVRALTCDGPTAERLIRDSLPTSGTEGAHR